MENPYPKQLSHSHLTTIDQFQAYIVQLTSYINETNRKYTKNMTTLKQYYQSFINDLQMDKQELEAENLQLRNQKSMQQQILMQREKEIKVAKNESQNIIQEKQLYRNRVEEERQKMDVLYEQITSLQQKNSQNQENSQEKIISLQNQVSNLNNTISQKQNENDIIEKNLYQAQKQIEKRYSLPEKVHDLQLDHQKMKMSLQQWVKKYKDLEISNDQQRLEFDKCKIENQKLRISHGKNKSQNSEEVCLAVEKERQQWQNKHQKQDKQREGLVLQISQLQLSIKSLKNDNLALSTSLQQKSASLTNKKTSLQSLASQKQSYVQQFSMLKSEYEDVIKNLEQSLVKQYEKYYVLEQKNRDMEQQLDGLKELLRELRAINDMNVPRESYRKYAEMEVISKKESQQKQKSLNSQQIKRQQVVEEDSYDQHWNKLLTQLDQIPT